MTTTLTPSDSHLTGAELPDVPSLENGSTSSDPSVHRDDPRWARPALCALLGATALLYLWGLGASGWANSFYSAAAQAGSANWKAWFFGSSDAANAITVDKPPLALWVMGLSARIFGVNAWSILVPQALMGVASVGMLYATVKRWFGPAAGLLAGVVLATTPVATLMFRFNNPDALLVLLLTTAAWCLVRALETTSTRWVVATWSLVGCAFLTKMLQALLVAPAFALVYLVLADTPLRRRIIQSAAGLVALVVSSGWYVAVVELWPTAARPYIGGSQHNSLLELILGYNGLGRLTGNETGSANNGGMWGATGWGRMFNAEFGSQASWLLPAALILLVAGLWWTRRAPRTDRTRAALAIWGGWLVVTVAVFSFGQGIIHPYYTVALAPAIGALVGIGAHLGWQRRAMISARIVLAGTLVVSAAWAHTLLSRSPDWMPALAPAVAICGGFGALVVAVAAHRRRGRVAVLGVLAVSATLVAAPLAYSLQTASVTHQGALPSAGPSQGGGFGPGGGRPGPGGGPGGFAPPGARPSSANGPFTSGRTTGRPMGFGPGANGFPGSPPRVAGNNGNRFFGGPPSGPPANRTRNRASNVGGLLDASTPSARISALLTTDAEKYRWAAAAIGSNSASGFQLASREPVMAIGGFNGSDPSPTLAQFKRYVADGSIHWFIAGGGGPAGRGATTSTAIESWVTTNFTPRTVDGVTLYDLTT